MHFITMTWKGIHPAMSPQVPCKSEGQHLISLLVYVYNKKVKVFPLQARCGPEGG